MPSVGIQLGYLIVGSDQGFVMNPGGSSGNLCLSNVMGRNVGLGQVQGSGPTSNFTRALRVVFQ